MHMQVASFPDLPSGLKDSKEKRACTCTCMYMTYTFSRIDNGMDVVYGTISVDVSVGGVVGREAETAERAALIQV